MEKRENITLKNNKIFAFIEKLIKGINENHISEYSAQCSYYTILSFIPFTILLITLIQYTNIGEEALFNVISKIIPSNMSGFILDIVKEVYSKSIGTISISIIFTLWSAGKGLYALMKGLNDVYDKTDKKSNSVIYLRIMSIVQTIIFILLITIGLIVLVFGSSLISIAKDYFGGLENYNIISDIVTKIGYIIATFIIFLILYKLMSKQSFKSQIPGAIFGSIALNIVSFVFSKYLDIFKGFSITYGSLTTLMLVMMWIYACFYSMFIGSQLNAILLEMFKNQEVN